MLTDGGNSDIKEFAEDARIDLADIRRKEAKKEDVKKAVEYDKAGWLQNIN